jgi:parallel beta-helix repeat protein
MLGKSVRAAGGVQKVWLWLVVAVGLAWPSAGLAQQCPGTITANLVLQSDLIATASDPNPCIVVGADNLTINLNGHTLDVSALGDSAVAIDIGSHSGTTVVGNGGAIVTAYASSAAAAAIHISGGSATTITGVIMTNAPSACSTTGSPQANGYGTAIRIENATGASVTANQISCFLVGIAVANSVVPRRGTGVVSGNTLTNNTNPSLLGAAGILLQSSSGWSIENNQITFSGSNLPTGCKSSTGQLQDCSPALQLLGNASNNEITNGNQVRSNYGPGIYAQAGTSGNRITNNTALFNPTGDLWDDNPTRSNFWNRNTCGLEVGSVAPQKCP